MIERRPNLHVQSSTVISHPNRFQVINISDSPRYSAPDFDVIDELLNNRSHYLAGEGDPTLSILSLPTLCTLNIERLRDAVALEAKISKKPGLHCTLSACIYYGVSSLIDNDHVKSLLTSKTKLNLIAADVDSRIAMIINGMFSQYTLCTNLPHGKRCNIFIPNHIHAPLASLANDLSSDTSRVHLQALSVIAIMHTLSLQPETLEDQGLKMKEYVDDFTESVGYLNRAVRCVIKEFKL